MDVSDYTMGFEFVVPSPKLRSAVWQYFGFYKINGSPITHHDRTLCKLCNNLFAYNSGCTTNMRQHLVRSHKIDPQKLLLNELKRSISPSSSGTDEKEAKLSRRHGSLQKVDQCLYEFVPASASLRASVWQHFGFYKDKGTVCTKFDKTWCKLCDHFMVYSGGSTTNMRSHLVRHHEFEIDGELLATAAPTASSKSLAPVAKSSICEDTVTSDSSFEKSFADDYEFVPAKPHLKAKVWNYFGFYKLKGSADTLFDKTCCKLCKTMLRYVDGCTTNMRSHLGRAHSIYVQSVVSNGSSTSPAHTAKELKVQRLLMWHRLLNFGN